MDSARKKFVQLRQSCTLARLDLVGNTPNMMPVIFQEFRTSRMTPLLLDDFSRAEPAKNHPTA